MFEEWDGKKCDAFSIDVEDLFYSVPHQPLFSAVEKCIESSEETAFRSACGLSVESFMELLSFYLENTFVAFNDEVYFQRQGIFIGSRVAPVLCDIF